MNFVYSFWGIRHGKGKQTYGNDAIFEGTWKNEIIEGVTFLSSYWVFIQKTITNNPDFTL